MGNFPDAHKVYDLAAIFRQRVIEEGRSFLWPDQEIWTKRNVTRVHELLLEGWEPGLNDYSRPAQILADHSPEYLMIGTDVMASILLFTQVLQVTQEPKLRTFLTAGNLPQPDTETYSLLLDQSGAAFPGSEKSYPDSWQKQYMSVLYGLVVIKGNDLVTVCPPQMVDRIERDFSENNLYWDLHMWGLLHTMYPHQIPGVVGKGNRDRLLKHYGYLLKDHTFSNDFEAINHIRSVLERETDSKGNDTHFDFYDLELLRHWSPTDAKVRRSLDNKSATEPIRMPSVSHIILDRAPVYEIGRLFKSRVIEQQQSLLWPNEKLWTDDAIESFLIGFKEMPVEKGQTWLQVYEGQFGRNSPDSARILADSYAFLMQFPAIDTLSPSTKDTALRSITGWVSEVSPDQPTMNSVTEAFALGVGSPGRYFSNNIQHQLAFVPAFVRQYRNNLEASLSDAVINTAHELSRVYDFSKSVIPARNIVLHLLDPENFERIASRTDKTQIVDSFTALIDELETDAVEDLDTQIRAIRQHLAGPYFSPDFDFYDSDISLYWNSGSPPQWPPASRSEPEETRTETISPPSITHLADKTFLDETFLRDIESLLESKQQLIFEGPPGSGKTYVAEQFARYFTGQSLDESHSHDQVELIQFHQSYSYEDFVEGIRPRTNEDGQLVYDVEPGIFRVFADRAKLNPDKKFVLIIDEINRGNVSRILGELMLLLEYRDKSAMLPYSKDQLQIPANLYIIGTMNTADRSLSQIDYALRRRFYFVRFMSVENGEAHVLNGWLRQRQLDSATHATVLQAFITLNQQLETDLGTDDLQVGHSYFMDGNIHSSRHQQHIWSYAVLPLIREYLYHHRERDSLLQNYQLERIIRVVEPVIDDQPELETLTNRDEAPE